MSSGASSPEAEQDAGTEANKLKAALFSDARDALYGVLDKTHWTVAEPITNDRYELVKEEEQFNRLRISSIPPCRRREYIKSVFGRETGALVEQYVTTMRLNYMTDATSDQAAASFGLQIRVTEVESIGVDDESSAPLAGDEYRQLHAATLGLAKGEFAVDQAYTTSQMDKTFIGWHFGTKEGIHKTAFAAVNKTHIETPLKDPSVVCVCSKSPTHKEEYACLLYNHGKTLQSREESMVLTRPVRVLVRGPSPVCEPTVCTLEGYIMFTEAHRIAVAHAVGSVLDEARRLVVATKQKQTVHSYLNQSSRVETLLRLTPSFETWYSDHSLANVPREVFAVLVQAIAVLFTGYADAGRNFRDRASRHEGGRHAGEAMRSVLKTPIPL